MAIQGRPNLMWGIPVMPLRSTKHTGRQCKVENGDELRSLVAAIYLDEPVEGTYAAVASEVRRWISKRHGTTSVSVICEALWSLPGHPWNGASTGASVGTLRRKCSGLAVRKGAKVN